METEYSVNATGFEIMTNIWGEKVQGSFRCFGKTFTNLQDAMIYIKELQEKKHMCWNGIMLTTHTNFAV